MALETATYIDALVTSNPDGADARSTADDHLRLIKAALKRTFPQIGGAVSASAVALSYTNDLSRSAQAQLNELRDGSATAKNALVATTCISASSAAELGGYPASSYARLDTQNTFQAGYQIFAAGTPRHLFLADTAPAGHRGWMVNYATYESAKGILQRNLTEDSGTAMTSPHCYIERVQRTISWVEKVTWYVGSGGSLALNVDNGSLSYNLTNPIQLNGIPAASYARLDTARTFAGGIGSIPVSIASAASITPNCSSGDFHRITLTSNTTLNTPLSPRPGQTLVLAITQGGTGSYSITWSTAFRFGGGVLPTLSTTVGARDVFAFIYDDLAGHWLQSGLDVKR